MITRSMGYFAAGRALNSLQITLLAETLLEDFPHETLSDVALFLRRAAKGEFEDGKTFGAMDIPTVLRWWRSYLDEKAQQVERDAQREKDERGRDTVQALGKVKGLKELVDKMAADREERRNEEDKAARIHRLREGVGKMSEQELRDQWALRPYADERSIIHAEAARRGMLGEDVKEAQRQTDAAQ
jgi:cytochrome P450